MREISAEVDVELEAIYTQQADVWSGFRACNRHYLDLALDPEFQRIVLRDAPSVLGERLRQIDAEGAIGPLMEIIAELIAAGEIVPCDP